MIIGLLSDTHGHYDESLEQHFGKCHEIWHAGDIGDETIIERLQKIAPVQAVYGNIDGPKIQQAFPEDAWVEHEGLRILITHIVGSPLRYNSRVNRLLAGRPVDILVCGHSHICKVQKDEGNHLLYVNPGAAGHHGFHAMRTVLRLELGEGKVKKLEVIELGKRGQIPNNENA